MELQTCNPLAVWNNGDHSYVRIIELIAKKSADLAVGEGIILNASNDELQKYLDDLVEKTQLSTKLYKFAYINSKLGRAHLWIIRTESGDYDFVVGEMLSNIRVAMYNEKVVGAQLFTSANQGDSGGYYQIEFREKEMTITSYVDDKQAIIGSVVTEVPKSAVFVKREVFKTGIDIVPIIETTNLPKPRGNTTNTFIFYPDWEAVPMLISDLQEIIKQKRKERRKNQTWFNGNITPQLMKMLADSGDDMSQLFKDGFIQNNVIGYTKGNDIGMEITYGNPPMGEYNADSLFTEIQIFNGCGYNHPRETEFQSYTNKAQTLVNAVLDEQTTRVKQQYYKSKLYILFDYIIRSKGFGDGKNERPYSIDFKSIGLSDILQKDTLINSRLQNGTMSREQAIQEYEGISAFNAKKELELINKEMAENPITLDRNNDAENGDDEGENGDIVGDVGEELV